jgi:two-component system response regulator MprA
VKQPRILVIEQDPVLTASIVSALEEAGFSVTTANDVVEGLRKVYENYADLAILANGLPLVDGEEPVLYFRQTSYLPILVLGNDDESMETLDLGADAYMPRPPSLQELVARVRSLLRRKSSRGPRSAN